MTYAQLLAATLESPHQLAEQSNHPPLGTNEIEIQSHWFAGHFSSQFQSNHGQDIHIISPGEWNRGAGPDFLDAVITIDGETHKGPIELDLDTQNWDLHGHRENPDFNNVTSTSSSMTPAPPTSLAPRTTATFPESPSPQPKSTPPLAALV